MEFSVVQGQIAWVVDPCTLVISRGERAREDIFGRKRFSREQLLTQIDAPSLMKLVRLHYDQPYLLILTFMLSTGGDKIPEDFVQTPISRGYKPRRQIILQAAQ